MYKIAETLPYAHIAQTKVRCHVSGKLIGESEPVYRLPSGHLISESTKNNKLERVDDRFICPITKQSFNEGDLQKVYFT